MKFPHIITLYISISALTMLIFSSFFAADDPLLLSRRQEKRAAPAAPDLSSSHHDLSSVLFPGLDQSRISMLSVAAPDRSFEFRCETPDNISVNGNQADEEIFNTLVAQIQELPVNALHPFTPEDAPALVLRISTHDGAQHVAHFYNDDAASLVQVFSGSSGVPVCHSIDPWRIGTLMMTCEGTRIQDASGNEIPADF